MPSVNRRLDPADLVSRIRENAAESWRELGDEADDALRDSISTAYPPASAPGSPPHRRTGNLLAGVGSNVEGDPHGVDFRQSVTREGADPNVPAYLEHGTRKMAARPFLAPIRETFLPRLFAAAKAAIGRR